MNQHTEDDHIASQTPFFTTSSGDTLFLSYGSVSGSSTNTSVNTTVTDDFMSTAENVEDLVMFDDEDTISARAKRFSIPETDDEEEETDKKMPHASIETTQEMEAPLPTKDLAANTPVISPSESEDDSLPELDNKENNKNKLIAKDIAPQVESSNPETHLEGELSTYCTTRQEESHPDAAANAYNGAKGVWAWGKTVPVFSPFMGIAEAVAGKALEIAAGTNLQDLDSNLVQPQLQNLDSAILNPAIETVTGIMLGAADKAGAFVKPIVVIVLSPFKMLQQQPSNDEQMG